MTLRVGAPAARPGDTTHALLYSNQIKFSSVSLNRERVLPVSKARGGIAVRVLRNPGLSVGSFRHRMMAQPSCALLAFGQLLFSAGRFALMFGSCESDTVVMHSMHGWPPWSSTVELPFLSSQPAIWI